MAKTQSRGRVRVTRAVSCPENPYRGLLMYLFRDSQYLLSSTNCVLYLLADMLDLMFIDKLSRFAVSD